MAWNNSFDGGSYLLKYNDVREEVPGLVEFNQKYHFHFQLNQVYQFPKRR